MRIVLTLAILVAFSLVTFGAETYFIGTRYAKGDHNAYRVHARQLTTDAYRKTGGPLVTTVEQTTWYREDVVESDNSRVVLRIVYDSAAIELTADSVHFTYSSRNPADTVHELNRIVLPVRALLGVPLTIYMHPDGHVDSVAGVDAALAWVSRRSPVQSARAIAEAALSPTNLRELIQGALANLPNRDLAVDSLVVEPRARMLGRTQYYDTISVRLQSVANGAATLERVMKTRIASPIVLFGGERCIVDSSSGDGVETILFDLNKRRTSFSKGRVNTMMLLHTVSEGRVIREVAVSSTDVNLLGGE